MAILAEKRSDRRVRVLLTGFSRFPGAPANPSAAIVAAIARADKRRLALCGIDVATAVFPVDFAHIGAELARYVAAFAPDAVLHLGLAGRRSALTVEARARNRCSLLHPDATKRIPVRRAVVAGAPDSRRARLPVMRLVATMGGPRVPVQISNDAGAYVCNAMLYLTLGKAIPLAGFIHVPWPRAAHRPSSCRGDGRRRPSRAMMVVAITRALLFVGAEVRRNRRRSPHRGGQIPA